MCENLKIFYFIDNFYESIFAFHLPIKYPKFDDMTVFIL